MNWRRAIGGWGGLAAVCLVLLLLCAASISLGAGQMPWTALWSGGQDGERAWRLLMVSRVPRTLALLLAGMALAVAGLIMQMLVRNRFVEPSTSGTAQSAALGILIMTLLFPSAALAVKTLFASALALIGTSIFLMTAHRLPPPRPDGHPRPRG